MARTTPRVLAEVCKLAGKSSPLTLPFGSGDEARFGRAFPAELRDACQLAAKGALPQIGALTQSSLQAPFIPEDRAAAIALFRSERQSVHPLLTLGHLSGLAPFAYTGVSVYWWYVHIESTADTTPVYELSVFDDAVTYRGGSIAEIVAREILSADADDKKLPEDARARLTAVGKKEKRPKLATLDDPLALVARSRWVLAVLSGHERGEIGAAFARAPAFTAFADELGRLAKQPSLALYWLTAHALLGNDAAFARAAAATKATKSTLVAGLRDELARWIDGGRKGALLADSEADTRDLVDQVRTDAPKKLLDPAVARTKPALAAPATDIPSDASDLERAMLAKPDDVAHHLRLLAKETGIAEQVAALAAVKKGLKFALAPPNDVREMTSAPDQRLTIPIVAMLRAGLKREYGDKKACIVLTRALGPLQNSRALDLLVEMAPHPKLDSHRRLMLGRALARYSDPRATEALAQLVLVTAREAKDGIGHQTEYALLHPLELLGERRSPDLSKALAAAAELADSRVDDAVFGVGRRANDRSIIPLFDQRPHYFTTSWNAHFSAALATYAPETAKQKLPAKYPHVMDAAAPMPGIGEYLGAMLAGLIPVDPTNARTIAVARHVLTYDPAKVEGDSAWGGVRGVLIGLECAPIAELMPLVKPFVDAKFRKDQTDITFVPYDRVPDLARRALAGNHS